MFCKKCGKEIREGAKFCPGCGASAGAAAPTPAPMPAKPAAPVSADAGYKLAPVPETRKKKSRVGIIVLLCVLLLLAAGIGVCYAFRDVLFGKRGADADKENLDAANAKAEDLYTAAQEAVEIVSEEGVNIEAGYYLFAESYEKPDEAPELPENGAVSVSEPDYFLWLVSEEFEELEELEGFGFYVEDEEIAAVIVEQDDCIGAYPTPVLPEDAEDLELSEEALDYAADGNAETDPEGSAAEETAEETTEAETDAPTEAPTEAPQYSWYLEPEIEAEDINVAQQRYQTANYGHHIQSEYSIIKIDGKYGMIDQDGNIIIEPDADRPDAELADHYVLVYPDYEYKVFCTQHAIITTDGSNYCEECDVLSTTASGWNYYYDLNMSQLVSTGVYSIDKTEYYINQTQFGTVFEDIEEAVTAREIILPEDMEDYEAVVQLGTTYGVVKNNEVIAAFEYENATSYLDGVAALCKDGKWGYVNEDGEEILPFVFDADLIIRYEYTQGEYHSEEERLPYLPSEGYIAVNTANGGGYFDTAGNEVIPVGIFEEARPVYNGLAWVKKDGLWGVITLDGETAPEAESAPSGAYPQIVKTYTGTYYGSQGETGLDFTIESCDEEGHLTGYFSFYAVPSNPDVPSGEYWMEGTVKQILTDGSIEIEVSGTEWVVQPSGYQFCNFSAVIDAQARTLISDSYSLSLTANES